MKLSIQWPDEKKGVCVCDCLPCKTSSCDNCQLAVASKGRFENNYLCNETFSEHEEWNRCLCAYKQAVEKEINKSVIDELKYWHKELIDDIGNDVSIKNIEKISYAKRLEFRIRDLENDLAEKEGK